MTEEELWPMSKNRMRDQGESKLPVSSKMNITSSFARTSASPSKDSPSTIFNSSVEKATEKCEENRLLSASNAEENRTIRRIQRERTFSLPCATAQWIIFSLLLFAASSDALLTNSRESAQRRCSPITIPMCQKLGYNQTYFPNRFGHETQEEAGMEAHQFWPLVNVNCYSHLRFFLCAMYAPICQENYDKHVPPCREVCMAAKNGCVQLMQKYGFAWPETLNCNQLPRQSDMQNTGNICAAPPNTPDLHIDTPPSGSELDQPGHRQSFAEHEETPFTTRVDLSSDACDCRCSRPFYLLSDAAMKKVTVGNVSHCAYPCYSPFLRNDNDQQNFLTTWIGIWSIACFCLSLFTVLTFVIEVDRFQYPERPIFVLAFCQMMVSCGYILRLGYGHDMVACEQVRIRNQADGAPLCIAVFVLVYFFGMAAAVWWVVLALTWLLAAGFKWSSEAIASYAPWFHVFAWALPALQTFIVLMFNFVDGDPMSGICYVGNTNLLALRTLVLGPLIAYLTLGAFFLVAGFMNLWRIRAVVKKQQGSGKTNKLTQLMSKIGVFSVLYTIPAMAVIGSYFYESHYRPLWEAANNCPCAPQVHPGDAFYLLSLIKYASTLIVGVTSGVWIFSRKTLSSWRRVFCSLLHCRLPEPSPSHLYQPADLIYIKSHTDVSSSQVYGSTVRHHGGYGVMMPEKL